MKSWRAVYFLALVCLCVISLQTGCSKKKSVEGFHAPENLNASDGSYIDRVKVTWDGVIGADRFVIYRSASASGTFLEIGISDTTSYDDFDAIPVGTTYYYKAKAWSSTDGYSDYSLDDSGAIGFTNALPVPVINVSAVSSPIVISWNTVTGATSYFVYREGSSDLNYALLGSISTTSYSDTTAIQGVMYNYKVRAWSSSGYSDYSAVVSGQVTAGLATPTGVSATMNYSSQIDVSWIAVSGAGSYVIKRSNSISGPFTTITTVSSPTISYSDTTIPVLGS